MITIRTIRQIATSRAIPSFRSAGARLQRSHTAIDQARIAAEKRQLLSREHLRQWRNQLWQRDQ